jgi:hypothetical protein
MRPLSLACLSLCSALWLGCSPSVVVEKSSPVDAPPGAGDPPDGDKPPLDGDEAPPDPEPSAFSCDFGSGKAGDKGVLAWVQGWDLRLARADGESFVAFTFQEPIGDTLGYPAWVQIAARDGFVAATLMGYGENNAYTSEAVLLSSTGKVVWSSGVMPTACGTQYLGAKGALAMTDYAADGQAATTLVLPGKPAEIVDGIWPVAPPSAEGTFAALLTPMQYVQEYGWYVPGKGTSPLAYPVSVGAYPMKSGERLFYVGKADPGAALVAVAEAPGGIYDLPISGWSAYVSGVSKKEAATVRVDWDSGSATYLFEPASKTFAAIVPPADRAPFGMQTYQGPALDEGAGALFVARTPAVGGLYRSDNLGKSWKRIGKSVSNVWDIQVTSAGGTYVLRATDEPGYFAMDEWQSPGAGEEAPEQVGPSVEVVQPQSGLSRALDPLAAAFVLSDDGACLAYVEKGHFWAMHLESGATVDLGPGDIVAGVPFAAWIP